MASIAISTLGCRLNQAEAEAWAISLARAGYQMVDFGPGADAYIVNTCTVTHVADRKSRQRLYQASRYRSGVVMAAGCLARRCPQEVAQAGAGVLVDPSAELVAQLRELLPPDDVPGRVAGPRRGQAQVKVQEGCSLACSYCIIPRVRGLPRSRPLEEIAGDIRLREGLGYQEVVLTGTLLGHYGRDLGWAGDLAGLVRTLLAETSVPRLRLSSLLPRDLTADLLALWESGRLVRHFHLPVQSGSDRVLRSMGRPYSVRSFRQAVGRLRACVPDARITTDLLVGFPGEREDDFEQSLALCQEIAFSRVHVFPYSQRPGTEATRLPDQVPVAVIRERCHRAGVLGGAQVRGDT